MRVYFTALCIFFVAWGTSTANEITFSEGTNFGISLSPDGQMLAMDLQGIMWTVPTVGGTARALTSGQQPEVREPSFSPDGKKIAFQGFYQGYFHIWSINVDGSGLTQITSGAYDDREPSWNADGESIVYASDRDGSYDIWEIDLDSGREVKLTSHPDDAGYPHKSPDGERLIFTREIKRQYSEIIMIDYDDDEPAEMTVMKSESDVYMRPTWANNSEGFSYITQCANASKLSYVTDVYNLEAQKNEFVLDAGDVFPFRPSWSKKGIYYTADGQIKYREVKQRNARRRIYVDVGDAEPVTFSASIEAVTPNYTKKVREFDTVNSQQVRGIGSMDVSSKNNDIVFSALGDMWLQHGDNMAENIENGGGQINDPTWSRDGNYIAYVDEKDGQMDIWVREATTGKERRITNDKNREYRLSWSRDGNFIAYLSNHSVSATWGRADLKVIDVEYGNTRTIDENVFTPGRPTWSVDGEHVIMAVVDPATSRFREGMHALRQYNVESGRSKLLDMPGGVGLSTRDGSGPVISYDGGKMAYISEGEIRVAFVDTTGTITGAMEPKCLDTAHMPRWARGSQRVFYLSGRSLKSCNVMNGEVENHGFNVTWNRNVASDKTIHVEKFFDGVADNYRENIDVFIVGGRIAKIAPHGQDPVIGEFVDYSSSTMIPGLMAGHSHQTELLGEKLGRNWLAYGITSVRDPGSNPYKSLMRKETWEAGASRGPRMFYAGWLTGGQRIYYGQSYNALNERALRHELKRAEELDYDMIKSYVRLPDEFQQILIGEAHRMGIPLSSHEIAPAVQNSMDSVEHIAATSRRGYSPKFSHMAHSYEDVVNILSGSGLFITPTSVLDGGYHKYLKQNPEYVSDIKYRTFLDEILREGQALAGNASYAMAEIKQNPAIRNTIKTLHDNGANFAAGTDSPFIPYGIAQHFEIIMFVEAGLTPAEAIRTSTINVAKNIGVEKDLGTLEVGKLADMAIIDGDPLIDIRDIRKVSATVRGGHVYMALELTTNRK